MPLTPSKTRELLDSLGHMPRKKLGQNFLIDGNIVRKSVQLAGLQEGDRVVEIGPGLGTLTGAMLDAGCHVHAVELDGCLARYLRTVFKEKYENTFHLVEGDALDYPCAGLSATSSDYKIVANLPYAITTPWMESLLRQTLPSDMVLMMQKEAATRITAEPGTKAFGAISVFVKAAYDRIGIHNVSRSCFYPVPGVDSLLLQLRIKQCPVIFTGKSRRLIRRVFTQRRKQIGRLLADQRELEDWLDGLESFGCSRKSRPEDIPLSAWLPLNDTLQDSP